MCVCVCVGEYDTEATSIALMPSSLFGRNLRYTESTAHSVPGNNDSLDFGAIVEPEQQFCSVVRAPRNVCKSSDAVFNRSAPCGTASISNGTTPQQFQRRWTESLCTTFCRKTIRNGGQVFGASN